MDNKIAIDAAVLAKVMDSLTQISDHVQAFERQNDVRVVPDKVLETAVVNFMELALEMMRDKVNE